MQQQPPSCSPATSSRPSKKRDAIPLWALPLDCPTGVAVIQLAKPLDGSETLQVVTYNAEGAVRGQYSDLTALGGEQATKPEWPLECTLNAIASTCRTEPAAKDGFTVTFSHAEQPSFTFTPVGAPTTDRREMVDGSGQRWAMSGHHSFELEEIDGYGNRISVSSPVEGQNAMSALLGNSATASIEATNH